MGWCVLVVVIVQIDVVDCILPDTDLFFVVFSLHSHKSRFAKVPELQGQLRERGLRLSGNKAELFSRLEEALKADMQLC